MSDEKGMHVVAAESATTLEEAQSRIMKALAVLIQYGNVDGDHHKRWAIVEAVRELAGDQFDAVVQERLDEGYEWSNGSPP